MKTKRVFPVLFVILLVFSAGISTATAQDVDKAVYAERRQKLMEQMEEGIAVFKNASVKIRNNDESYPYRADSDFYYLTGCEEPEACFILAPREPKQFILFIRPASIAESLWHGDLPGLEGGKTIFGADTTYPVNQFNDVFRRYLMRNEKVYFDLNNEELSELIHDSISESDPRPPKELIDVLGIVHEMRVVKDAHEIALLKKAIDITSDALIEVMKAAQPGMFEYEIDAIIDYVYRKNGSRRKGFQSIVGSGHRSTILHYQQNDQKTQDGDMVLMDIGAECGYYTADITRTIPVNGTFSKEQREIYELVLEAQEAAMTNMVPGKKLYEYTRAAEEIIKQGLFQLGLITDKDTNWQHHCFYFSYISHYLGMDVHDVGDYGGSFSWGKREMAPGMVLTIEPGIYVGENWLPSFRQFASRVRGVPIETIDVFLKEIRPKFEKYKNIGVRIEDDILITENGNVNLSVKAPRTVRDIQEMMKKTSVLSP